MSEFDVINWIHKNVDEYKDANRLGIEEVEELHFEVWAYHPDYYKGRQFVCIIGSQSWENWKRLAEES